MEFPVLPNVHGKISAQALNYFHPTGSLLALHTAPCEVLKASQKEQTAQALLGACFKRMFPN
eukprot:scaffold99633_cov18-Tisochrysis_lutea.AAC.4